MRENNRMVFCTNSNKMRDLSKATEYFFRRFGWKEFEVSDIYTDKTKSKTAFRLQKQLGLNEQSLHKYLTLLANYGFFRKGSRGTYALNLSGWRFGEQHRSSPNNSERRDLLYKALVNKYKCITRNREIHPYRWIFRYLNALGGRCSKLELGALFLINSETEYNELVSRVILSRERKRPEMIADVYAEYVRYDLVTEHDIKMIAKKDIYRPTSLLANIKILKKIPTSTGNFVELPGGFKLSSEQDIVLTGDGRDIVEYFIDNMNIYSNFA